jgi:hypothetical protein
MKTAKQDYWMKDKGSPSVHEGPDEEKLATEFTPRVGSTT